MSNFRFAFFADYYNHDIESQREVFEPVLPDKKIRRPCHSAFLRCGNRPFGLGEIFSCSCLDLNKNDRPVRSGHYQIYLASLAQKIPFKKLAALLFQKLLA